MQPNISIKKSGCYTGECMKLPGILEAPLLCAESKALDYTTDKKMCFFITYVLAI